MVEFKRDNLLYFKDRVIKKASGMYRVCERICVVVLKSS